MKRRMHYLICWLVLAMLLSGCNTSAAPNAGDPIFSAGTEDNLQMTTEEAPTETASPSMDAENTTVAPDTEFAETTSSSVETEPPTAETEPTAALFVLTEEYEAAFCSGGYATPFATVHDMQETFPYDLKGNPTVVRELTNLPAGYKEADHGKSATWYGADENGYLDYTIMYTPADGDVGEFISYEPYPTEEALRTYIDDIVSGFYTYEKLSENDRISNIRTSSTENVYGTQMVYLYDNPINKGMKFLYQEYTDPNTSVEYITSQIFLPDGSFLYGMFAVFDGADSYSLFVKVPDFTMEDLVGLRVTVVESAPLGVVVPVNP